MRDMKLLLDFVNCKEGELHGALINTVWIVVGKMTFAQLHCICNSHCTSTCSQTFCIYLNAWQTFFIVLHQNQLVKTDWLVKIKVCEILKSCSHTQEDEVIVIQSAWEENTR